jgi:hypothetical protein
MKSESHIEITFSEYIRIQISIVVYILVESPLEVNLGSSRLINLGFRLRREIHGGFGSSRLIKDLDYGAKFTEVSDHLA